ncbi:restriction endonuclease subunit S [Enterococcus sp. DIV0210g]|uniref:restriction endonuclease subunit S n=1 Tax=Enterococcus sp. DIV0210g TaxID=2774656 RepID=UPI003D2FBF3D
MSNDTRPEIRFPGFTEDWEERKLGEVFQQTVEYIDPKEVGLELWSVTVENGLTPKSERYNREFLVKKNDKFKAIHPDEIVYNPMNMTLGSIGFNNSGKNVAVSGYYVTMKLNKGFDSKYFAAWLPSPNAINLYKLYATGSLIERQRVQFPTLSGIKTLMPILNEQKQIGLFFKQLDDTIALHQRKLDLLKETKKGFLQKMFPKNGAKVPEIRFPGFTEDWEERKLGDITKISTGKLDANAMVENGKYDFYTSGIKKYRIDVAAFEGPSITIAGNGATVGYMHLADNKFNAYQRTYVLQEFLVDRSFIFSEIGNKLPKKIKQEARTGNIPYIVMDMLTELKLSIPQNNSEQQKIGSFFKQLDDTIALHQRKLDLLKETKKGFLQKMFV